MLNHRLFMVSLALLVIASTGCDNKDPGPTAEPIPVTPTVPAAPTAAKGDTSTAAKGATAAPGAAAAPGTTRGKVVETMNSGGYTYVALQQGGKKVWSAGPQVAVKVGDMVSMPTGMAMKNYHSKTLDRTFETVYFVQSISVAGSEPAAAPTSGAAPTDVAGGMARSKAAPVEIKGIAKAEGGKTVAEIYAAKADLNGKQITVRGKVVKYNGGIMGKNWMHIQDGSGAGATGDVTVTTQDKAAVGDTVLVKGKVATNRDFGSGYSYDLMLEEAKVTVE